MSVNIRVELDVRGLASCEQADEVRQAVQKVINSEGIHNEVTLSLRELEGEFVVEGRTGWPVVISGVRYWEPQFEARIEDAVGQVTAEAKIWLFCIDTDLERAMEGDTL
ncbi:hypothetical protein ACQP1W_40010 [Spirillospora sp. CA-255316]